MCDVPVIHCDFYPTLLAMAGLTVPTEQKVDGVSFAPLLEQKGGIAARPLFWHYPHYSNQGGRPCGAVRVGDDKLLEFFAGRFQANVSVVRGRREPARTCWMANRWARIR